jgi:hypothetical protein
LSKAGNGFIRSGASEVRGLTDGSISMVNPGKFIYCFIFDALVPHQTEIAFSEGSHF